MKVVNVKQGTEQWFQARCGIVTASEFDNLVTPTWKPRAGEMVKSYMHRKLAERWRGEPLHSWAGNAAEQGSIREDEAVGVYGYEQWTEHGLVWKVVGFITSDDGRMGCSPDSILATGSTAPTFDPALDVFVRGIESKCPEPQTHVKYLLSGELPKEYAAQVQGSMLVTGAAVWTFLSYARGFPPLVLEVPRDEEAIEVLSEVIEEFNVDLDAAYARLVEINGGEPERTQQQKAGAAWQNT